MILSDVISQANNATLSTSLDALLSQANGTGITAIVIAIVGIVAALVEYLRRSQQATANVANLDKKDTVLDTKVETKATELHNKTNQLETKATELHNKTNQLDTKADELNSQSKSRSDSFNESTKDGTASLKKTDKAVSDHANMFQDLVEIFLSDKNLRNVFENNQKGRQFLDKVNRDVIEWRKDFSAYYEKKQEILPEDKSTDSVIRKTADTRKLLSPHYDGIDPTTDTEVNNATEAVLKKTSPPST
jgi:X-X-X-Leu-X-X-Gly heptad repeat protein